MLLIQPHEISIQCLLNPYISTDYTSTDYISTDYIYMIYYIILYYVMLCYVMLYYIILYYHIPLTSVHQINGMLIVVMPFFARAAALG